MRVSKYIAITCINLIIVCSICVSAEIKDPYLHLSFDREFQMDGAGTEKLKSFPKSLFLGVAKVPAGKFVEGISGKAFIPSETLIIQGKGIFPAPEGTISLWIKPVNYEKDWIGGQKLTTGKIGAFLRIPPWEMKGEKLNGYGAFVVRRNRHDYASGLHWVESWGKHYRDFSYNGSNVPFVVWQKDKWRMLTVVWLKGERRVYLNGMRIQHGTDVKHDPSRPGGKIVIPAGSKVVDELMVWDVPLTDAQVAALFFSQMPQSSIKGTVQDVPLLAAAPNIGKVNNDKTWKNPSNSSEWIDSFSGMVSDAKDTLDLGHRDGYLFIRYREPMPKDYIAVKTLIGGKMLKRSIAGHDGNVRADDSVELCLTGDGGKTNYVFAVSASGALYDARNGNKKFNISKENWIVQQDAGEKFWTVEMRLNLAALFGGKVPQKLGFNFVRTVRQQGFAQRQWSFNAGDIHDYGLLTLDPKKTSVITAKMNWSETTGKLSLAVHGIAKTPVMVSYSVTPLSHIELFPKEKTINDLIRKAGKDKLPSGKKAKQILQQGKLNWQGKLDYTGGALALASLLVKDAAGTVLARRAFLISGSEAVSTRIFNLPSRQKMVVQVFLSSKTLAGNDVVADISITPAGKTKPVLQSTLDGFNEIMKEAVIDVSGVKVGSYIVEVTVKKNGKVLGKKKSNWFKSGDPEWLGNDIGIIKSVPKPWTSVKKKGNSIEVWGRTYSFAGSLLPASMRVLNKEILAGPMRLIIKTANGTIDTARVKAPVIVVDKAGIKASISGKTQSKDLIVEIEGELEFDGFAYFKFTFKPVNKNKPVLIKSIIFEVPFKKEYAKLYDDSNYNILKTKSGSIPAKGMKVTNTGTIRVGDTIRGVQFWPFFKSSNMKTVTKKLSFIPTADAMTMRYIVSKGITLKTPVSIKLGIIGTPVKPHDTKRVRMTMHGPDVPVDLQEKDYSRVSYWFSRWTNYGGGSGRESGYFNYTPEWCKGFAKSQKKKWNKKRHYKLLKIQPGLITAKSPEYALFWKEWGGQYYDYLDEVVCDLSTYRGAEKRPPGVWTKVDWTNRSWQDFFFYSLDKVLATFAAEGIRTGVYVDCTAHQGDIKKHRQWMQRLYQVVRKNSPEGLIAIHMSGDHRMAMWGMADTLAEGEQYTANWKAYIANKPELTFNDCHPTLLPLDRMRATYAASLWGPQTVFLSQLWTDKRQKEKVFRKANHGKQPASYTKRMRYSTGLMLAHDTQFWGEFYACGVKEDPGIKRARWGYDETVKFIPYWNNCGMFEVETPDKENIVVSAWLKPDGNLMIIILNNNNKAASVRLKINASKFPVALKKFVKAVDITSPVVTFNPKASKPDTYEYKDGILEVDMRPRDFRLLVFE